MNQLMKTATGRTQDRTLIFQTYNLYSGQFCKSGHFYICGREKGILKLKGLYLA